MVRSILNIFKCRFGLIPQIFPIKQVIGAQLNRVKALASPRGPIMTLTVPIFNGYIMEQRPHSAYWLPTAKFPTNRLTDQFCDD